MAEHVVWPAPGASLVGEDENCLRRTGRTADPSKESNPEFVGQPPGGLVWG
jgi:hypothetical protein